jgi:N-acylneuraminate cytidylyltransferase|tara:strand:- start:466 stop:1191 length:726 start_codon:yes stop_codon:yes gene_type:complete
MIDVVAIIPARSSSKGVPGKNIKLLAGKPLLAYSIAAARLSRKIDRVIVSTDSEHYANIAREYGAETPFIRPAELSADSSGDYEWIKHALDWIEDNDGYQPEYLVHLRPTTPLREVSYIDGAIERIKKDNDATALRSMHEMSETAYKTLEIEGGYLKCICSGSFDIDAANLPRQTYEKTYVANGYVDIIRSSFVIENEKVLGNRVIAYITPGITDIDTLENFEYLEYQIAKYPELVSRLFG